VGVREWDAEIDHLGYDEDEEGGREGGREE